jgi:anti-sigma B factor antagonist
MERSTVTIMNVSEFESVLHTDPPFAYLTACGELDAFTSRQVLQQVDDAVAAGCTDLRLDLGRLTFIDAAGIGLLVRLRAAMTRIGGSMELVEAGECVRRLCAILELGSVFGLAEPQLRRGIA